MKFAVLSALTFDVYVIYWLYKHWQSLRTRLGADVSPVWRAGLYGFYAYSCFSRIRSWGATFDSSKAPPMGWLVLGWLALSLTVALPAPFSYASLVSFTCLLPVQAYANRINAIAAPSHDRNGGLTVWNGVAVLASGLRVALTIALSGATT